MSTFAVVVKRIRAIEPHPNADLIEFAVIDGYRSVVKKGALKAGDLVAYIPEASVLPVWLLKRLGFWSEERNCGRLNGKEGNRVKATAFRGELSEGICYPVRHVTTDEEAAKAGFKAPAPFHYLEADTESVGFPEVVVSEGDDVAFWLNITKYEPPIPVEMAGQVFNAGQELTLGFDVENWKSYPDILKEGDEVVFTEKLHGTCTVVAILPYKDAHPEAFGEKKNILIFSKGLGSDGLVFKNNVENENNLYVRSTRKLIAAIDQHLRDNEEETDVPQFFLGETFGPGVQDLAYGKEIGFRVFAAAYGYRGSQRYQDWDLVDGWLKQSFGYETVPVLYRGPFSVDVMKAFTDGETSMDAGHIREGIVMVPVLERLNPVIGRVCLKSVSADYLTRKNGTEYT